MKTNNSITPVERVDRYRFPYSIPYYYIPSLIVLLKFVIEIGKSERGIAQNNICLKCIINGGYTESRVSIMTFPVYNNKNGNNIKYNYTHF